MTTYTAIANSEIAVGAPVTNNLMTKMRDNPLAIQENDASAPTVAYATTAGNGVTNGDSHDHSGGDGGTIALSSCSGTIDGTTQVTADSIDAASINMDEDALISAGFIEWLDSVLSATSSTYTSLPRLSFEVPPNVTTLYYTVTGIGVSGSTSLQTYVSSGTVVSISDNSPGGEGTGTMTVTADALSTFTVNYRNENAIGTVYLHSIHFYWGL